MELWSMNNLIFPRLWWEWHSISKKKKEADVKPGMGVAVACYHLKFKWSKEVSRYTKPGK